MRKRKYTVILLLPDYCCDSYGETVVDWEEAESPLEAQRSAQKYRAQQWHREDYDPALNQHHDWQVVAVFEGALVDLRESD